MVETYLKHGSKHAKTHNTTFSGHFPLLNFGHPFMFSHASTSDSGNGEKWDIPDVPAR
jgi:hypothetical protein